MKPKRIIGSKQPWGRRNGGWLMSWNALEQILSEGDVFEFKGIQIGAITLKKIIRLMRGGYDCLITANGNLEIETGDREVRYDKDGARHVLRRKPTYYNKVSIRPEAWLPREPKVIVKLSTRKKR